jgi:nicotinamidase-related amidase
LAQALGELLDPSHTALITQECQRGVIGDLSALPELARAGQAMLPNLTALVRAARAAGAPVIHCTALRRADGRGANRNARIFGYMAKSANPLLPDSPAAALVPELDVAPTDFVLPRLHGLSPFQGTELDFLLRNLGVRTLVGVGVSVNVAIQNLAFDAVNASYQMVIPRDAVAGFPRDYVDAVFSHTLGAVATLVTSADVIAVWRERARPDAGRRA